MLDFVVIGGQKGGTTSLWRYLCVHPSIAMPELKEEPFFCTDEALAPGGAERFLLAHFGDAPAGALLGKATPQYMRGFEEADVEEIARRMAAAMPDGRLIALLRDPIDRAVSQYRMSVRRGLESRSFDAAATELLEPEQLAAGRRRPTETNSYLVQGEYGRLLAIYRKHFPARQLHVELTADLDCEPARVLDRIRTFLELDPGPWTAGLDIRYHRGGRERLLDRETRRELLEFMSENVWPALGERSHRVQRLFGGFLEIWDVKPDDEPIRISGATRSRLEKHYAADANILNALGYPAPWTRAWSERGDSPKAR